MRLLATAGFHVAPLLAAECKRLGLHIAKQRDDGVELRGRWRELARALVGLRVADRLLIHLGSSGCGDADLLYEGVTALPGLDWIDATTSISVFATGPLPEADPANRRAIRSHVFGSQRIKDGVVDVLRERYGRRPDVDPRDADVRIIARFHGERVGLFLDASGAPLSRRGYRNSQVEAPLAETLAAAVVMDAGYKGKRAFHDPMCGSGTLAIEAGMVAARLAPGAERSFAVERWPLVRKVARAALDPVRERARDRRRGLRPGDVPTIVASDTDPAAVAATRNNVRAAGLARFVRVELADATTVASPADAYIIANPPYGERIGDDVLDLYARLGSHWGALDPRRISVLDGHEGFVDALGLPVARTTELRSGRLDVRLRHLGEPPAAEAEPEDKPAAEERGD